MKRVVALPGVNGVARAVVLRRRGAGAAARLPAPVTVRQVEGRVGDVAFVMNDPAQCILAKELHWGRGHRPRSQDQFALEVFARLAAQADHVLDIGSYTGIFSLVAAKANPVIGVDAFEIVPSNFLACWGNVITNDLVGRVDVHLQGVGARGSIRMPPATHGSALPDFWSVEDTDGDGDGVAVPVETLDRIMADLAGRRSRQGPNWLVKVDVEGHETALVTAGRDSITRHRPTFLMEILPGADTASLTEVLGPAGYRYYLITEDRLHEADRLRGEDDYRDWLITTLAPHELESLGVPVDQDGEES
ncbi:MAG: FkbM family methyltransferase [Intrasporangiaceae bacterium]|nr:FkbM family methyltransferase [Intrasporangiaceae bacterium]